MQQSSPYLQVVVEMYTQWLYYVTNNTNTLLILKILGINLSSLRSFRIISSKRFAFLSLKQEQQAHFDTDKSEKSSTFFFHKFNTRPL